MRIIPLADVRRPSITQRRPTHIIIIIIWPSRSVHFFFFSQYFHRHRSGLKTCERVSTIRGRTNDYYLLHINTVDAKRNAWRMRGTVDRREFPEGQFIITANALRDNRIGIFQLRAHPRGRDSAARSVQLYNFFVVYVRFCTAKRALRVPVIRLKYALRPDSRKRGTRNVLEIALLLSKNKKKQKSTASDSAWRSSRSRLWARCSVSGGGAVRASSRRGRKLKRIQKVCAFNVCVRKRRHEEVGREERTWSRLWGLVAVSAGVVASSAIGYLKTKPKCVNFLQLC